MDTRPIRENAKMDWSLSAIRKTDIGNICLRVGIMISSKNAPYTVLIVIGVNVF